MTTYIAYLRVSTDRQGRSGLGLEAQEEAVRQFMTPHDVLLAPPFVEVESGTKAHRPQLMAAMEKCRKTGATLLIAKLDRLSRNVAFVANLMETGVEFVAIDFPNANKLTLHIMAAFAEHERDAISARTKAALAAAKARGGRLGGDRGYRPAKPVNAALGQAAVREKADRDAHRNVLIIEQTRGQLVEEGVNPSLGAIAGRLNREGHATPRGGLWTATAVKRALGRVGEDAALDGL
jgi:DNA invertase Pin-like site-specific DNA recombinase